MHIFFITTFALINIFYQRREMVLLLVGIAFLHPSVCGVAFLAALQKREVVLML